MFLRKMCPCKLSDCVVYQDIPVKNKATNADIFYIQRVVNNSYSKNPCYATLSPVNRHSSKEEVANAIRQMNQKCAQCRQKHPIDMRHQIVFRPSRIDINFMPFAAKNLGKNAKNEMLEYLIANNIIRSGK